MDILHAEIVGTTCSPQEFVEECGDLATDLLAEVPASNVMNRLIGRANHIRQTSSFLNRQRWALTLDDRPVLLATETAQTVGVLHRTLANQRKAIKDLESLINSLTMTPKGGL